MDRFAERLGGAGFADIKVGDETAHMAPTVRHMNRLYFAFYLPNLLLKMVRLRTTSRTAITAPPDSSSMRGYAV